MLFGLHLNVHRSPQCIADVQLGLAFSIYGSEHVMGSQTACISPNHSPLTQITFAVDIEVDNLYPYVQRIAQLFRIQSTLKYFNKFVDQYTLVDEKNECNSINILKEKKNQILN